MENFGYALDGAWKVLAAGLLLGAGLPALFAMGIRSLALGAGGEAEVGGGEPHLVGRVLAGLCFAVVVLGVAGGITLVVAAGFGKELSFAHVVPTLTDKA